MSRISKRMKIISEKNNKGVYNLCEAFDLLRDLSTVKFKESVDVAVNLSIDSRKSDQIVRGTSVLPVPIVKKSRIAVLAEGKNADDAKRAGADIIGFDNLLNDIKNNSVKFDVIITTPDNMKFLSPLGPILGPKGLMPSLKFNTLTQDIFTSVMHVKNGQICYKSDKSGIVHAVIGKINFTSENLKKNFYTLMLDLKKNKPLTVKSSYFKKITVSSTMGPGLALDILSLTL